MTTPAVLQLLTHNYKLSARAYKRLGPEDQLAVKVASALREWTLSDRLEGIWTHPPQEIAGGTKNAALKYAIASAMGSLAGTPDYLFISVNGGAAIELKSKIGRLTENQSRFEAWAKSQGVPFAVCRSLDEVEAFLVKTGLLGAIVGRVA